MTSTVALALAALASAQPSTADAAAPTEGWITAVDLITIGPGDHLWTSFGHTALAVTRFHPQTGALDSKVYNWGDADFGGFGFVWSFFRGHARFRLTEIGTIEDVVNLYAGAGRTIHQQRLALTPEQVAKVVEGLEYHAVPERREYRYHHLTATCGTKVRDFLDDEILGGAIARQLDGQLDPHTPRWYGRKHFAGFFFAEIFNDLFMGRLHDRPWTKVASMTMPANLSSYLTEVQVPDPKGGDRMVPLAAPPTPIVRDVPEPPYRGEGRSLIHITYLWIALAVLVGAYTLRRRPVVPEDAGFWLLIWAVPVVIAEGCMVFGALVSSVPEGRINELMISFPITDVALLVVGLRWWRGAAYRPTWLTWYARLRLGLVLLALAGHAAGVLIQEPRALLILGLVSTALLNVVVARSPRPAALSRPAVGPSTTQSSVTAA